MSVRLGFAVAAFLDPEILIVDEVLAVGDAEFQKKAIGKMQDISSGEGRTVLFVSHNMASIQNLCKSGLFLQNGTVKLLSDDINEVINLYLKQVKSQTLIPISERKDRQGEGRIYFTDFKVIDKENSKISIITSGQDISILFAYDVKGNHTLDDVTVAVSFRRSDGFMVSVLSTEYYLANFNNVKGQGLFSCKINQFPFSVGEYSVNIMIREKGIIQDWIADAAIIEVENGDFYGTGQVNPSSHPGVLLKHEWSSI
jgi:lipopolysaccharide transport system ATP-binding protein